MLLFYYCVEYSLLKLHAEHFIPVDFLGVAVKWTLRSQHRCYVHGIRPSCRHTSCSSMRQQERQLWNQPGHTACSPHRDSLCNRCGQLSGHYLHGFPHEKQKNPAPRVEEPQRMLLLKARKNRQKLSSVKKGKKNELHVSTQEDSQYRSQVRIEPLPLPLHGLEHYMYMFCCYAI